jgi:hypothetical protein
VRRQGFLHNSSGAAQPAEHHFLPEGRFESFAVLTGSRKPAG